ncbi:MAG TPA: PhoH family protein, partial [Aquificaceae bacterium]|nr:PhoH family protein [Aquificaceae bacterium]
MSKVSSEERVDLGRYDERFYAIVGRGDENVRYFSKVFDVRIVPRGTELIIRGEDGKVRKFMAFLRAVMSRLERESLTAKEVRDYAKDFIRETDGPQAIAEEEDIILITHRRRAIVPKTENQRRYVSLIREKDVVFGVGPAGTGKTYLAMAMAVSYLKEQKVNKIILTRPAVEAGEKLGFLPGTIAEKVDPYLRPLYDALYDMVDYDKAVYMLERNI